MCTRRLNECSLTATLYATPPVNISGADSFTPAMLWLNMAGAVPTSPVTAPLAADIGKDSYMPQAVCVANAVPVCCCHHGEHFIPAIGICRAQPTRIYARPCRNRRDREQQGGRC
ncbi:hypothetical protein DPEC_G00243860 [Dallia pectoralis]|uniref:Uncharacterized protein n=1 Tax=Dallia pectoralis TaxID=75939 RepID=A0ACC2FVV2_DALPE|nr:hypothetical protein DPEC_G00243860 [Dallia pectoralis]